MASSKPSSPNGNYIDLGDSFFKNSSKAATPVFLEIANAGFSVDEDDEINQSNKI